MTEFRGTHNIETGDIVWIELNPTRGHEKQKTRPCLVLQKKITSLDLITVLPITDDNGKRPEPFFIKIPNFLQAGLKKKSVVDCYQIRTVSLDRLIKKSGEIDETVLDHVKSSLALILGIHSYHLN